MARVGGVEIPNERRVEVALTYIYGIGSATSAKILAEARMDPNTRVRNLTEAELSNLREIIDRTYRTRGRPPAGAFAERQAVDGYRLLPGAAPPQGPALAGAAHPHQRADEEGPKAGDRRKEEIKGAEDGQARRAGRRPAA